MAYVILIKPIRIKIEIVKDMVFFTYIQKEYIAVKTHKKDRRNLKKKCLFLKNGICSG